MATSKVPKFGAWEGGEENYTVYFDKARNSRQNGPKINPNDPEENPEMFRPNGTWAQAQVQAQPQTRTQAQTQTRTAEKQRKQTNVVPHFGAWENGDATGYTQCFEHVRRARHTGPPPSQNEPRPQARTQTQAQAQNEPQGRTQAQAQAQGRTQAQTQNEPQPQGRTQAQAQTQNEPQPQARTQGQGQGRTQGRPGSREGRGTYVPKFGDWEGEVGGGGYTVVFDNLKNKHNNNPNGGPLPNRDVGVGPTSQDSRATVPAFGAWEDGGDDVQYTTYFDNAQKPRRADNHQPQMMNRDVSQGGSSVASHQDNRHGRPSSVTPATVNPRASRQNQQATTIIPNFGGWNNDPSQADRYTKAFEMAKQERQTAVNNNSNNPSSNSYYKQQLYSKQKQQQPACCTIL